MQINNANSASMSIGTLIKARLRNIYIGITTGNWHPFSNDVRTNFQQYKKYYIIATGLIILYILADEMKIWPEPVKYPLYWSNNPAKHFRRIKQKGGAGNNNAAGAAGYSNGNNSAALSKSKAQVAAGNNSDAGIESTKQSLTKFSSAAGLCSGDGFFAKVCQGAGSGISWIFKFLGIVLLAISILVLPAIVYMILVFLILKVMFKGLRSA